MKQSDTIVKIAPALLKAQEAIKTVIKDQTAKVATKSGGQFSYTYADLSSVIEAIKKPLNSNDLMFLQPITGDVVETRIVHTSGEWISDDGVKILSEEANNPQKQGSAITYARRYGLMSLLGIPAEDDDAQAAIQKAPVNQSERPGYYQPTTGKVVNPALCASPKQVQLIAILLKKKGQRDEDLKAKYKVEHKKELTKVQASQIIDNLVKLPDAPEDETVNPDEIPESVGA